MAGAYTLQITPSASCAMARTPLTFPMTAAPTPVDPSQLADLGLRTLPPKS